MNKRENDKHSTQIEITKQRNPGGWGRRKKNTTPTKPSKQAPPIGRRTVAEECCNGGPWRCATSFRVLPLAVTLLLPPLILSLL